MDSPGNGTETPAVGARCVTTRRIGGASRPSTSELVHIDPPRAWGESSPGPRDCGRRAVFRALTLPSLPFPCPGEPAGGAAQEKARALT
jgi:hypothetical protein